MTILCVLLAAVLFAGCAKTINKGTIVAKDFKPEYRVLMMLPIVISNGNGGTTTIPVPYYYHYPNRWNITISGEYEGKIVTEVYYVDQNVYDDAVVGEFISFAEVEGTTEEPYTKEKAEQ